MGYLGEWYLNINLGDIAHANNDDDDDPGLLTTDPAIYTTNNTLALDFPGCGIALWDLLY